MTDSDLPLVQSYQPTTFRERGLAVGFTTPLLAGARMRPTALGGTARPGRSIEIIVPNPSGGRGVYVVDWECVGKLCKPTLHDVRLGTAIETHHRLHNDLIPSEIRRLTRNVVREGFAGRAAAQAGRDAATASEQLVADTHRRLLRALADSAPGGPGGPGGPGDAGGAGDAARTRRAIAPIALETGQDVDGVAAALERLAHLVAELEGGLGDRPGGFVARGLGYLGQLSDTIGRRARNAGAPDARAAAFIVANAELTLSLARRASDAVRTRLAMPRGLAEWVARPAGLIEAAARPEWLLDGWCRICLLWEAASPATPPAVTIAEMAALVPPIPPQADEWLDLPAGTSTQANPTQQGSQGGAAQEGREMDVVARNEQLLALAA